MGGLYLTESIFLLTAGRVAQSADSEHLVDTHTSGRGFLIKKALPEALRKKPSHQEGSPGGPSCIVFGFLPRRPSEEHAVGQLDIQSQPYEGLNSKCLARIYANKQYTTSGGSGSRKRTHTNTKASKNYAAKPPDEEPLYQYMGSTGTHPSARPQGRESGPPCAGGRPLGGAALRSTTNRDVEHFHSLRLTGHQGALCARIAL